MSDFELNSNWDVDKTAESLNSSLFGKDKKTKKNKKKSGLSIKQNQDIDNDDEKLSKKEKKRMKEKRRKINKSRESSVTEKTDSIANNKNNSILVNETVKKKKNVLIDNNCETKSKSKNKHKKKKVDKTPNKIDNISESSLNGVSNVEINRKRKKSQSKDSDFNGNSNVEINRKRKKSKDSDFSGVSSVEINRKRKRSQTNDSDSAQKPKKVKIDKVSATENNTENTNALPTVKRKNRKKKNTSRKNREKQLALKNKPKASLAVVIRESKDIGAEAESRETVESHEKLQKNVHHLAQLETNNNEKKKKSKKLSQSFTNVEAFQTNAPQNTNSLSKSKLEAGKKKSKKKSSNNSFENVDMVTEGGLRETQDLKRKKKEKKSGIGEVNSKLFIDSSNKSFENVDMVTEGGFQESQDLKRKKKEKKSGICEVNSKLFIDSDLKKKEKKKKQKKENGIINNISDVEAIQEYQPHKNLKSEIKIRDSAKGIQSENSEKISEKKLQDSEVSSSGQSLWDSSELGTKARDKLKSARFRFINEQLYTCTGSEALKMFHKDREAFQVYHEGYEKQVSKWPVNPVDIIIRQLKSKPTNLVIADFGCGDAKLAACLPHTVHSFDLVAVNDRVTVCDMSKTPLPNESVDVAVFCLSLMGTNIGDYILEANRILKDGGLLKIVEVVSRFKGVSEFIGGIYKRGFQLLNKRDVNEMFYQMDFKKLKTMKKSSSLGLMKLNPCLYKKR